MEEIILYQGDRPWRKAGELPYFHCLMQIHSGKTKHFPKSIKWVHMQNILTSIIKSYPPIWQNDQGLTQVFQAVPFLAYPLQFLLKSTSNNVESEWGHILGQKMLLEWLFWLAPDRSLIFFLSLCFCTTVIWYEYPHDFQFWLFGDIFILLISFHTRFQSP
jgi:hypothetical protein